MKDSCKTPSYCERRTVYSHRSAMETTNGHIKELDAINIKILKVAKFVDASALLLHN